MRCGSEVQTNAKGLPVNLQASHFWGRGRESTRFDDQNVEALCGGCHSYLTANPELHRAHKLKELGQREYDALMLRASTTGKRDDKWQLLISKELLKSVLK